MLQNYFNKCLKCNKKSQGTSEMLKSKLEQMGNYIMFLK